MPRTKQKPLSWKAKKKGEVYCAPACGRGCTHAEYRLALKRAKLLATHMNKVMPLPAAGGWVPQIHENLGWHYKVSTGDKRIHVSEYWPHIDRASAVDKLAKLVPDHYNAMMNEPSHYPGGRWCSQGCESPEEAVREVIAKAIEERDTLVELVNGLIEGLDGEA